MLRSAQYIRDTILIDDGVNSTLEYCKPAQVGVDLTVRDFIKLTSPGIVLKDRTIVGEYEYLQKQIHNVGEHSFIGWHLKPGSYIMELNEGCRFGPNDTGYVILRSSLNRNCVSVCSAVWDPNYTSARDGKVDTMSVRIIVDTPEGIYIEENARTCQLTVATNEDTTLYNGQFQGGLKQSKLG